MKDKLKLQGILLLLTILAVLIAKSVFPELSFSPLNAANVNASETSIEDIHNYLSYEDDSLVQAKFGFFPDSLNMLIFLISVGAVGLVLIGRRN
ncbi:hypothetical protein DSCO28_33090 [Desulfosarcina ovata subsp. sediminis]|uniref:Uncharacterized protein n=1 Tax=Desulfosarcina ovata subsp. sediminis TaxID=885957 RepID=A0A5K7ZRT5_9BACT|nr:hypothetical protein [Desulfosarcina ovata]BBO82743.1 hypothetical protein DSCO28_33090 [Desulfosarcina ovata subsp. sediminis]